MHKVGWDKGLWNAKEIIIIVIIATTTTTIIIMWLIYKIIKYGTNNIYKRVHNL